MVGAGGEVAIGEMGSGGGGGRRRSHRRRRRGEVVREREEEEEVVLPSLCLSLLPVTHAVSGERAPGGAGRISYHRCAWGLHPACARGPREK